MASIDKSIKLAILTVVAVWLGAASARVPYVCYQSEIMIGDKSTGGEMDGIVFYLSGRINGPFMDELTMVWPEHESSSDLRCWDTKVGRRCRLSEDSGVVDIDFSQGLPQLRPYRGQIYLGRDDGGQYHIAVAPNNTKRGQPLEFRPISQALCDFTFPEASKGTGREIVVPPLGKSTFGDSIRGILTLIPIKPKN